MGHLLTEEHILKIYTSAEIKIVISYGQFSFRIFLIIRPQDIGKPQHKK